jgi:predicted TIM-barrel fold metal-dependent hydrolase
MPTYNLVSADGHVYEPPALFRENLPAQLRERAPRVERIGNGDAWVIEGVPLPRFFGSDQMAGVPPPKVRDRLTWDEVRPGARDPHARLEDMAKDGVDADVLYPGVGFRLNFIPDPELRLACVRVYNDWMVEYCRAAPDRLIGGGLVPLQDVDVAIAELRRVAELGLRNAVLPSNPEQPVYGAAPPYDDPVYEQLWTEAENLGIPLALHIAGSEPPQKSADPSRPTSRRIAYDGGTGGRMPKCADTVGRLILSGVLERHPKLRVIMVESGIGYYAYLLEHMDLTLQQRAYWAQSTLKELPSTYFRRQMFATFQVDRAGILAREITGLDSLMWGYDYPHVDSTWPESNRWLDEQFRGVPEAERRQITVENAARLYGLA